MTSEAERRGGHDLPRRALLTGHMDRVQLLAGLLDDASPCEGLPGPAVTGRYSGHRVLVLGTGMGGPPTVRAVHVLAARGVRVAVRVGGAGPVHDEVTADDLVVATAAVRHEGASRALLEPGAPAVADPDAVAALHDAARATGKRTWVGVVHSKDSFFGEVDPEASPVTERLTRRWQAWARLGVLASEMEAAALFAAAQRCGVRAGAVLRVNDVHTESGGVEESQRALCQAALDGTVRIPDGTGRRVEVGEVGG